MLVAPERIRSAAEGKVALASDDSTQALADNVQRVIAVAVPILRAATRGARFTRAPWVLAASTTVSVGFTIRTGIREVQVLGSLIAHRLEEATRLPADPELVRKLAVELYLDPGSAPDLSGRRLRLGRLARRWIFSGALGRESGSAAGRALDAAERLDLRSLEPGSHGSKAR